MLLGRVEPFRGLDERARLTVVEHAGRRVVDKGQMVFWQDDPGEAMFVLLEGSVKLIVCSRDGELIELHRHDAPAIFGELALLDAGPRSASAEADIVSGVAINILALGLPRFMSIVAYGQGTQSPRVDQLPTFSLPRLGEISPIVPLTLVLGVVAWFVLNRTVFGLRLRSAGENPRAAESLGVRVRGMRWAGVLISGALAGLAGGYLSIELVGLYREGMNQGRGFIALAALILGNWSPIGAALSCLLFAWTEALTVFLRVSWINNAFIQSLPYIVTLIVLALFFRRVRPPKAVGQAYEAGSPV